MKEKYLVYKSPKAHFFAREGLIWNKWSRFSERIATPDKTVKALFQIDDTFTLSFSTITHSSVWLLMMALRAK